MNIGKNTFGEYEFESWVPQEERDIIANFWGQMGRTSEDYVNCCDSNEVKPTCSHGPGPNGFGNPPNGAMADYMMLDYKLSKENGVELFKVVRGRYIHRWSNIGTLIDEYGECHHVSSCNRWVRVWQEGE